MACVNCGLRKDQHEYNRDGGSGSGKPKKEHRFQGMGFCEFYRSPRD